MKIMSIKINKFDVPLSIAVVVAFSVVVVVVVVAVTFIVLPSGDGGSRFAF